MSHPAITTRSSGVWAHSAPSAWLWNFCSQTVHAAAPIETAKNGISFFALDQRQAPSYHHQQSARTTGSITVDDLLNIAAMAQTRDVPYFHQFPWPTFSLSRHFRKNRI